MAGCSDDGRPAMAPVEGVITLDGQPLEGATVVFQPPQGKSSHGQTDANGHYELIYLRDIRGALLGTHSVTITTATEMQPQERLPDCYHRRTELTAEVASGGGEFDFALHSSK